MGNDEQQHAMDVLSYWCAVELFSPQNWRDNQLIALSPSRNDDHGISVSEQERLPWNDIHADLLIGPVDNEHRSYTNLYNDLQSRKIYRLQTDMNARLTKPFSFAEDTESWLRSQAFKSGLDEQAITGLLEETNQLWRGIVDQPDPLPVGTKLTDSMVLCLLRVVRELAIKVRRRGVACAVYCKDYDPRFVSSPVLRAVKLKRNRKTLETYIDCPWLHHERFRIAVGLRQDVVTNALMTAATLVRNLSSVEEIAQNETMLELAHRQYKRGGGLGVMASLMEFCIGDDGRLVLGSLAISQYAKAVSCLFNHRGWPDCPTGWPDITELNGAENEIESYFNTSVCKELKDVQGQITHEKRPVTKNDIRDLIRRTTNLMRLDDHSISCSPLFSPQDGSPLMRNYVNCHLEANSEYLNGGLIDSFFLDDLEKLHNDGPNNFSRPVRSYLSMSHPRRFNLAEDSKGLLVDSAVKPSNMPIGRWPSASNQFQSVGQQFAINQIRAVVEGICGSPLLGVNGPPGTGKTTLLKDVVAEIIVARAKRLAELQQPDDIFKQRRYATNIFDRRKSYEYWTLDPSVTGFEIVVASSNNKAVENVSQDLPRADAIDSEWESYIESMWKQAPRGFDFRDIATLILNSQDKHNGSKPSNAHSTWALISAVLGNRRNKKRFLGSFKDEFVYDFLKNLSTRTSVIDGWEEAKRGFNDALKKEECIRAQKVHEYNLIRSYSDLCDQRSALSAKLDELKIMRHDLKVEQMQYERQITAVKERLSKAKQAADAACAAQKQAETAYEDHLSSCRAHPLKYLFQKRKEQQQDERKKRTTLEKAWKKRGYCDAEVDTASQELSFLQDSLDDAKQDSENCEKQTTDLFDQLTTVERQIAEAEQIQWPRPGIGDDHVAWMDQEWSKARTEVYIKALALHQQAVMGAAHQFMCNLSLACAVMQSNGFTDDERLVAWQTFFLVIPVVSSSFASISRMFSGIGKEALGWAIVDEAGQALPQAAAGLLQRVKHAVAVGDPMQLQPVDTMPKPMRELLASTHHLQRLGLESENMQALVDYQTPCGLLDETDDHWLGMPLVVHRRCDEPMFSICNDMAYSGRMVRVGPEHQPCAYQSGPHAGDELPDSCWYDVPPNSGETGKTQWRPQEGYELHKRLCGLFKGGIDPTNILVIAPFRAVANQVRDTFADALRQCTGCNSSEASRLASSQAGTVHTSQGREADVVFIVLGSRAGKRGEGSRSWVNGSPNLLNVAVSRAKRRVYVVGNLADWKNGTYTSRIAKDLPVEASMKA